MEKQYYSLNIMGEEKDKVVRSVWDISMWPSTRIMNTSTIKERRLKRWAF